MFSLVKLWSSSPVAATTAAEDEYEYEEDAARTTQNIQLSVGAFHFLLQQSKQFICHIYLYIYI